MINALLSSKPGATKAFVLDNVTFGWNSISMMFLREYQRISKGLTRMVLMHAKRVAHHQRCMDEVKCHTH